MSPSNLYNSERTLGHTSSHDNTAAQGFHNSLWLSSLRKYVLVHIIGITAGMLCSDRVKQIKNEAVVNENPLEKLIRELREENERLKQVGVTAHHVPHKIVGVSGWNAGKRISL